MVQRPRTDCGITITVSGADNWESDHSTYFALHFMLFEHLELLEHRATYTSIAGKTDDVISSFLVVSAYLA